MGNFRVSSNFLFLLLPNHFCVPVQILVEAVGTLTFTVTTSILIGHIAVCQNINVLYECLLAGYVA